MANTTLVLIISYSFRHGIIDLTQYFFFSARSPGTKSKNRIDMLTGFIFLFLIMKNKREIF